MATQIASMRALVPAAVAVLLAAIAGEVAADTRRCADLEARLAAAAGHGDGGQRSGYDRDIETQQAEIDMARARAEEARCGFAVEGERIAECAAFNDTIERMEDNLLELRQERDSLPSRAPRRERARLMEEIEANGCREGAGDARRLPRAIDARTGREIPRGNRGRGLREGFAAGARRDDGVRRLMGRSEEDAHTRRVESYRTMCVRTCDGYYFPISYSVPPGRFTRDQRACQARCPGTDVALYAHRVPGEEPEDMISTRTGEPYSRLPTAFAHRDTSRDRPEGCGCNPPKNYSVIAGEERSGADRGIAREEREQPDVPDETSPVPRPWARPDPAADPETQADRAGGLGPAAITRLFESGLVGPAAGAEDDVRVVGPAFLPDPEEAVELPAPDRPRDR